MPWLIPLASAAYSIYSSANSASKAKKAERGLEEAVNETMWMINEVAKEAPMEYFVVLKEDEEIGYVCKIPNNLYSFGININYRTKENLSDFWERVKEVMEDGFICMLFPQNVRAINWLKKMGMVEVEGVENNCTCLLKI